MRRGRLFCALPCLALAQTAHFDVVSVKPATVPPGVRMEAGGAILAARGSGALRNTGGPGTDDPGRIHYPFISLKALIGRAYGPVFDISAPTWTEDDMLQVDATMPAETTKAQFQEMLRNLLAERFKLQCHNETKQVAGYSLVVAKGGSKLKPAAATTAGQGAEDAPHPGRGRGPMGPDGFPIPPANFGPGFIYQSDIGDRLKLIGRAKTTAEFAEELGQVLHSKVADGTALSDRYDIALMIAGHFGRGGIVATLPGDDSPALPPGIAPSGPPLPDLFSALQSELGLKLEPSKVRVEILVVDHADKTPQGN